MLCRPMLDAPMQMADFQRQRIWPAHRAEHHRVDPAIAYLALSLLYDVFSAARSLLGMLLGGGTHDDPEVLAICRARNPKWFETTALLGNSMSVMTFNTLWRQWYTRDFAWRGSFAQKHAHLVDVTSFDDLKTAHIRGSCCTARQLSHGNNSTSLERHLLQYFAACRIKHANSISEAISY